MNRSVTANTGKGIHSVEENVEQEECLTIDGQVAVIDIKYIILNCENSTIYLMNFALALRGHSLRDHFFYGDWFEVILNFPNL